LIEDEGCWVIYGVTDSVFVLLDQVEGEVKASGPWLADYLNDWWASEFKNRNGIPVYLEVEFQIYFGNFSCQQLVGPKKEVKTLCRYGEG